MRKLENTEEYNKIIQKIKDGDIDSKKELASFTFFDLRDGLEAIVKKLKIKVNQDEMGGFIYSLLWDYVEKATIYENYATYRANILKAFESRAAKYKKEKSKLKKEVVFDHSAEHVDKNIVVNEPVMDPDDYVLKQELIDLINTLIIKNLEPREQTIIIQYFGLDGQGRRTMEELGNKYGVARERIRQVIEKGLKSIKKKISIIKDNKSIKDYADDFRV